MPCTRASSSATSISPPPAFHTSGAGQLLPELFFCSPLTARPAAMPAATDPSSRPLNHTGSPPRSHPRSGALLAVPDT